jgi:hypothetical protein
MEHPTHYHIFQWITQNNITQMDIWPSMQQVKIFCVTTNRNEGCHYILLCTQQDILTYFNCTNYIDFISVTSPFMIL